MINLQIPERALQLMTCKTISGVFDDLIKNGSLPLMELLTFGGVITPIINNETNQPEAYVAYWYHNGQVTVCLVVEDEQLKLLGVETLPSPSCAEALQLYYKYQPAPESSEQK